jgi:hypothetical protein
MRLSTFCITYSITVGFLRVLATVLQSVIIHISKTYRYPRKEDLQSIMLDCYVYFVKCFISLSWHHTENTVSVVQTSNGEQSWMYLCLQYKRLLFLYEFNQNWKVSINYGRSTKYEISRKSALWESPCSMHTYVTRLTVVACRDFFANAPKNRCRPLISFPA